MHLDKTSLQLLDLLLRDARMPVQEMARSLHRNEAVIRECLDRLREEGIVRGFGADVDPALVGLGVSAVVEGTADMRRHPALAEALAKVPNVTRVDAFSEDEGLRIHLLARDAQELEAVVQERIAPLGLKGLDTRIVVEEIVGPRPPRLEEIFDAGVQDETFPLSDAWVQAKTGPVAG